MLHFTFKALVWNNLTHACTKLLEHISHPKSWFTVDGCTQEGILTQFVSVYCAVLTFSYLRLLGLDLRPKKKNLLLPCTLFLDLVCFLEHNSESKSTENIFTLSHEVKNFCFAPIKWLKNFEVNFRSRPYHNQWCHYVFFISHRNWNVVLHSVCN